MKDLKVNRLEIIDHTKSGQGRAYLKWEAVEFEVAFELQDDNQTLKIFLKDKK